MLSNFKIKNRLLFGFLAILLIMLSLASYNIFKISFLNDRVVRLADVEVVNDTRIATWESKIQLNLARTRFILLSDNTHMVNRYKEDMVKTTQEVDKIKDALDKALDNPESHARFEKVADARKEYFAVRNQFIKDKQDGKIQNLDEAFDSIVKPKIDNYLNAITNLKEIEAQGTRDVSAEILAQFKLVIQVLIVVTVVALIFGLVIAFMISNSIIKPLEKAQSVAEEVAKGNLNVEIQSQGKDEISSLMLSLQNMTNNLRSIISEIRNSSDSIFTASQEISTGNMDLSRRTEGQAAALEQASSSLEQFAYTVQNSSKNSTTANTMSVDAANKANISGNNMENVISVMNEIHDSSKKISEIISVMDSISFQTNLLALNAAVEAARAGEQGRGFAVVAGEVRNLSKRSADAAKDIKQLIQNSLAKVESGNQLVVKAGGDIKELISDIQKVSQIVKEINETTIEQSDSIAQINQVIAQIDDTTQKNAALVEESAAAADSLKDQSHRMLETVQQFQV